MAGEATKEGLGEFANGINGTAAKAGDLAQIPPSGASTATKVTEALEKGKGRSAVDKLFDETGRFGKRYQKAWDNPGTTGEGALHINKSPYNNAAKSTREEAGKSAAKGMPGFDPTSASAARRRRA